VRFYTQNSTTEKPDIAIQSQNQNKVAIMDMGFNKLSWFTIQLQHNASCEWM